MKNHYEDATSLIIPRNMFDRGVRKYSLVDLEQHCLKGVKCMVGTKLQKQSKS